MGMGFKKKLEDSPVFLIGFLIGLIGIVFGISVLITILVEAKAEAKAEEIESYNAEELLMYELKETEYDSSIKDLVEEYVTDKSYEENFSIEDLKTSFGSEDFNWIKEKYNDSLMNLYFDDNFSGEYDLNVVVEEANSGMDDYDSDAIKSFINIKRELLTSKVDKKLFTTKTEKVIQKIEQINIAQELKWEQEREEKEIYEFMKNAYNQITNFGADYNPEIHDEFVANLASEQFGISSSLAENIYIKFEMK